MQARGFSDGAGDVFDATALHALEVVVVVELVLHLEEGASCIGETHPADDPGAGEIVQDAVDGGQRHTAEIIAKAGVHCLSRGMRACAQGIENRDALHRDAQPGGAKALGCCCRHLHESSVSLF
jgi:hypothetical protein